MLGLGTLNVMGKKRANDDPILEAVLNTGRADKTPITLVVGGRVICGKLARTSHYFRAVAEQALDKATDPYEDFSADIRRRLQELDKLQSLVDGEPRTAADAADDEDDDPSPAFINLTKAFWQHNDGSMVRVGPDGKIRVRLSSVDAWFPGTIH